MNNKETRRSFLRKTAVLGAGTALIPWLSFSCRSEREFDILIRNGEIFDGLGGEPFTADIGITGDRITAIGNLDNAVTKEIINAEGLCVSPGFIDIHTHTGRNVFRHPKCESKIRQGVTLDISGNCGNSTFPRPKKRKSEILTSDDFKNYIDELEDFQERSFALNGSSFIGHGTIRSAVFGVQDRAPDSREFQLMKDLLRAGMEQGALGMSTGLEYVPGFYAETDEIVELCKVVAEFDGVYATHMRNEDESLIEALNEAVDITRRSGVSLQISHLKVLGYPNWHKIDEVLEIIDKGRVEGLNIHADRYPYLAYSTGLSLFFPEWALEGGSREFTKRLEDNSVKSRMRDETNSRAHENGGWDTVMIAGTSQNSNRKYLGRRLGEIAESEGRKPFDVASSLILSEKGNISIVGFGMNDENTERIIAEPYLMIGSDGYATTEEMARRGKPHPRSFGTFPRAIREYTVKKKTVSLPDMIRKITSLPAEKLRLKDRGVLKKNSFADITIFNINTIKDKATFIEPWHYAEGIEYLMVNGKIVLKDSVQTEALPGKVVMPG